MFPSDILARLISSFARKADEEVAAPRDIGSVPACPLIYPVLYPVSLPRVEGRELTPRVLFPRALVHLFRRRDCSEGARREFEYRVVGHYAPELRAVTEEGYAVCAHEILDCRLLYRTDRVRSLTFASAREHARWEPTAYVEPRLRTTREQLPRLNLRVGPF